MKHMCQRNARIAEEMILLAFRYGSKDISLNLKTEENITTINVLASKIILSEETILSITKLLEAPRCKEMEEYFWNLTGECDTDFELSLIGVMTNSVKINYNIENQTLEIILIREI